MTKSTATLLDELRAAIEENRFRAARLLFASTRKQPLTDKEEATLESLVATLPPDEHPVFNPMSTAERDEIVKGFSLNVETLNAEEYVAFAEQILHGTIPNPQNINPACLLLIAQTADAVNIARSYRLEVGTFRARIAKFAQVGRDEDYRLARISLQHFSEYCHPGTVEALAWAIELFVSDGARLLSDKNDDARHIDLLNEMANQLHFLSGTEAFEGFDTSRIQTWVSTLAQLGYKGEAAETIRSVIAMPIKQATAEMLLRAEPVSMHALQVLTDGAVFKPMAASKYAACVGDLAKVLVEYSEADEVLREQAHTEGQEAPPALVQVSRVTRDFRLPLFNGYQEGILFLLKNPAVCPHCVPEDVEQFGPGGWLDLRSIGVMVNRNLGQAKLVLLFGAQAPNQVAMICIDTMGAINGALVGYFLDGDAAQFATRQLSPQQMIGEQVISTNLDAVFDSTHTKWRLEELVPQIKAYLMDALESLEVYHEHE